MIAVAALFVALGGTGYAVVSSGGIPDPQGVFHGCVNRKTGALRVVKSATDCHHPHGTRKHRSPGEFAISWSQAGPKGPAGQSGQNGQNGAPGSAVAYAAVAADGTIDQTRAKNFPAGSVVSGHPGLYCVTPPTGVAVHVVNVTPLSTGGAVSAAIDGTPVTTSDWVFSGCGSAPRTIDSFIVLTLDNSGNPIGSGFYLTIN